MERCPTAVREVWPDYGAAVGRKPAFGIAILAALWGASYLFVHVALRDFPPGALVWGRVTSGLVVVLVLARATGALAGLMAHWRPLAVTGIVQIAIPVALIAIGQQWIASSLAGVLNGSVPIFVALLAPVFDHGERAGLRRALGIALGFAGVVAVYGIDVGTTGHAVLGAGCITLSSVFYAIGPLYSRRRLADVKPLAVVTGLLASASLVTLPTALLDLPTHTPTLRGIGALVVLGAGGTGLAFALYYAVMFRVGPGRASIVAYLIPLFSVSYGVTLLGEPLGKGVVVGLPLILVGSFVISGSPALARPPAK
jgi:drug/metabolite transporter (DMT)-like permease